jgi:hypothetical protein
MPVVAIYNHHSTLVVAVSCCIAAVLIQNPFRWVYVGIAVLAILCKIISHAANAVSGFVAANSAEVVFAIAALVTMMVSGVILMKFICEDEPKRPVRSVQRRAITYERPSQRLRIEPPPPSRRW